MIHNKLFCSYSFAINWLQNNLLPCPFKKLTGIDCPLCGLQRSIIALLKGDVLASLRYYPTTLLLMALLVAGVFGDRPQFASMAKFKNRLYAATILLISCSYLLKITGVISY